MHILNLFTVLVKASNCDRPLLGYDLYENKKRMSD